MKVLSLALAALVLASGAWARDSEKSMSGNYTDPRPLRLQEARAWDLSSPKPLKASPSSNRVTLTWTNIQGETGYVVERRTRGTQFAAIGKTTTDVTTYTDTLAASGIYQYRVRAYSASGGLSYSRYTNTTYTNAATSTIRSTTPTSTTGSTTPTSTTGSTTRPRQPGQRRRPRQPGQRRRPRQPGQRRRPRQPGQRRRPRQPGQRRRPLQPGQRRQPRQPGQRRRPQQPGQRRRPQQPGQRRRPPQPGRRRRPQQPTVPHKMHFGAGGPAPLS